jgi:hypothetical protein
MSDKWIMRVLLTLLLLGAIPMIYIGARPNYETLVEFGTRLYGPELAWTLPTATIGYELLATITYFLIPERLAAIRRTAMLGAIVGFGLTVILAMAWVIIHGGPDVGMKVAMKVVPSAVVAFYMHMVVTVWNATKAATGVAKIAEAPAMPTPEDLERVIAARVDAALAELAPRLLAEFRATLPAPAPEPKPVPKDATPKPATPKPATPRRSVAKRSATPPATPPVADPIPEPVAELPVAEPQVAEPIATDSGVELQIDRSAIPPWMLVAEEHVERAKELIREVQKEGGDPLAMKSGKYLKDFKGIKDRQVHNALQLAFAELGLKPLRQMASA